MSLMDHINRIGSRMYASKIPLVHGFADAAYNAACKAFILSKHTSDEELDELIREFRPDATPAEVARYRKDMRHCWLKYGHAYDEYFLYGLESRSEEERAGFISDVDRLKYAALMNDRAKSRIFIHKKETYKYFKKFYKREVIQGSEIDEAFIERHPRFVFKPEHGSRGQGVQLVDSAEFSSIEEMKSSIDGWDEGICEELIIQDERMAILHPQSINTCRIFTLRSRDGKTMLWHGSLRTGCGESFVDNAFAGGVFADIDCETGIVTTDGITERDIRFERHPDSGVVIKGFQIPEWDALRRTVIELAGVLPDVRYVGWDLALSDRGWVITEGNSYGQIIMTQTAIKEPIKHEILEAILR